MNALRTFVAFALMFGSVVRPHLQAMENPMPFVGLADFRIDPARLDAFEVAASRHAAAALHDEPGVLAIYVVAERGDPTRVQMFEMYADAAAHDAHLRTAHFRQFRAATESMTTARERFDTVPLSLGAKPALPSNPIVRTADLEIDPARLDAYKAAVTEEIEASIRVEPGVLAIYSVVSKETPNRIRFLEIYADENVYLLHRESPHFRKYVEITQSMITGRRLVEAAPIVMALRR